MGAVGKIAGSVGKKALGGIGGSKGALDLAGGITDIAKSGKGKKKKGSKSQKILQIISQVLNQAKGF